MILNFSLKNKEEENFFYLEKKDFSKYLFTNRLLEIPDCPKELWLSRKFLENDILNNAQTRFISIVGSRSFSSYAKEVLEKLIKGLGGQPIVVISGLALGIDALAHQYSLDNNLLCVVVPGSGIDPKIIAPRTNFALSEKVKEAGGLILSEFSPTTKAAPWTFPQRNRIMAALSDIVFVVEAREKSGTLITARLALDYNKTLATVPNSIFSDFAKGSNGLLKQGAFPITSSVDILELLGLDKNQISLGFENKEKNNKNISDEERQVLRMLSEPQSKDFLVKNSSFDISGLNTLLSIMEIKGLVKETLGKYRKR